MSKKIRNIVIILGILVVAVGICAGLGYYYILAPNTNVKDDGIIYLRDNSTLSQVLDALRRYGYIENTHTPGVVARLKRFTSPVKSGRYKIRDKMNNNELINMFRSGNQYPVYFTFNNMRTLDEFAGKAHEELNTSKEEFANLPLYHYNKDNKKLFITPNKKFVDYFYGGKQWRKSNGF